MNKRVMAATFGVAATALVLTGCGASKNGNSGVSKVDTSNARVIQFPKDVPNVSFKCNGKVGVYSSNKGIAAVEDDANCK